jgi:hypothetical protein
VDATLFQHATRWWLSCGGVERGANRSLFLWHAPDPLGPWEPHARNPVKIDVRSARPAGTPFRVSGELFRPAQDCSRGYGSRVAIQRVLKLDPESFAEETVSMVDAAQVGGHPAGLHTLSSAGPWTLIDNKREVFSGWAIVHTLRKLLAKRAGEAA